MVRVLIADDEPKIRKGIRQWIEDDLVDFQVVAEAQNGMEAIEEAEKTSPELCFVDINMPIMNGLDFIGRLKKISPKSIVVIITGYDDFQYAYKAIKLGVYDYLLKPVSLSEFKSLIRRVSNELGLGEIDSEINKKDNHYSCIVRAVKDYIDARYEDSQLDLSYIAQTFNISKSYISKLMKKELGMSFIEYLTDVRLNKAREILENDHSRVTVYNVSIRVGYTSQHYFSRVFKKTFGISPLEYRNKVNKVDCKSERGRI